MGEPPWMINAASALEFWTSAILDRQPAVCGSRNP
jgi:hypothetical protein